MKIAYAFTNPIKYADLKVFLYTILSTLTYILFPFLVLMMIYTGYLFVAAQGNPQKLDDAKRSLLWTTIGAVIVLAAFAIAQMIDSTAKNLI